MPSKKIGSIGKSWKIRRSRKPLKDDEGHPVWGYADFINKEIVLDKDTGKTQHNEREIVLHEAIHKYCPFLDEEFVAAMAVELDDILDVMEL